MLTGCDVFDLEGFTVISRALERKEKKKNSAGRENIYVYGGALKKQGEKGNKD